MKNLRGTSLLLLTLLLNWRGQGSEFTVDPSGHHLLLKGQPFFWLADTVWLLAQLPTREELEVYLGAREKQGFTVIQLTAVMSEERVWGSTRTNIFGRKPFLNDDPATPAVTPGNDPLDPARYDYWDHLDYVLDRVYAHGFRAAVVAMFVGWRGDGYKHLTKDNALQYGRFLGEGAYEDGPQYPTKPINDLVVRKQAYWSYFAGGYHTYGNGNVWHFNSFKGESTQPWKEALYSAGARNLITLRRFFDKVDWWRFVPDQRLLAGFEGSGTDQNCAMRTPEGDAFIFYLTSTNQITFSLGAAGGSSSLSTTWVNPATGQELQAQKLAFEQPKVTAPSGWKDALLYLKK